MRYIIAIMLLAASTAFSATYKFTPDHPDVSALTTTVYDASTQWLIKGLTDYGPAPKTNAQYQVLCADLDGTADYYELNDSDAISLGSEAFTIEMLVDTTLDYGMIACQWDTSVGRMWQVQANNPNLYFITSSTGAAGTDTSTVSIPSAGVHHIKITKSGTDVSWEIDGSPVSDTGGAASSIYSGASVPVSIGTTLAGGSPVAVNQIDWKISYFKLDAATAANDVELTFENNGLMAWDSSGNAYHGYATTGAGGLATLNDVMLTDYSNLNDKGYQQGAYFEQTGNANDACATPLFTRLYFTNYTSDVTFCLEGAGSAWSEILRRQDDAGHIPRLYNDNVQLIHPGTVATVTSANTVPYGVPVRLVCTRAGANITITLYDQDGAQLWTEGHTVHATNPLNFDQIVVGGTQNANRDFQGTIYAAKFIADGTTLIDWTFEDGSGTTVSANTGLYAGTIDTVQLDDAKFWTCNVPGVSGTDSAVGGTLSVTGGVSSVHNGCNASLNLGTVGLKSYSDITNGYGTAVLDSDGRIESFYH